MIDDDDALRTVTASPREVALPRGSKIALGNTDDGEGVIIQFTNNKGSATTLLISNEAADSLARLLAERNDDGPQYKMIVRLNIDGIGEPAS